ncbi:MAG: VirB8/TrbF family protein [Desulfobacterales bacterium]|nr:VirB8/TrbF family protein [Desulfobacterales bacterium]
MKTRFQERLEKMNRRFYEVFGDLEAQAQFLKFTTLVLLILLLLSMLGAFLLARKPPVVIRVTEVGKAEAVRDLDTSNMPQTSEILYFARSFVKRYSEYNSYTLARDIAVAMNLMTPKYQKAARRDLVESGLLAKIKEAELNVLIEFKEEKVERDTPDHALVSLIGVKSITSYKNPNYRESNLFKASLVLIKVSRSIEAPSGLLVENYSEMVLNKLEEAK